VAPAPVAAPPAAKENIIERLVALVSERTGYPPEMLGLDLDLEADLGVDSIKRVEILSALQTASASMGSFEGAVEELSKLKTLRAIAQWIEDKTAQGAGSAQTKAEPPVIEPAKPAPAAAPITSPSTATDFAVSRMVVKPVEAPLKAESEAVRLQGLVLITDDGLVAGVLAEKLNRKGVATKVIGGKHLSDYDAASKTVDEIRGQHGRISTLIHLLPLVDSKGLDPRSWTARLDTDLKSLYNLVRSLETDLRKEDGSGRVLTATRMGGSFAITSHSVSSNGNGNGNGHGNGNGSGPVDFWPGNAAVCGFVKSVAREWAEVSCRAVDFEFDAGADAIADALIAELNGAKGLTEVGYQHGVRRTLQSVLTPLATSGSRLDLQPDSVVLITGGARGITASIAIELAKNFRCKLVLAGRSPLPAGPESPLTAGLTDAKQVKSALLKQASESGQPFTPASIEAAYRKLGQEREIRSSLAAMTAAGSTVEYHSVDVTDEAAMGSLIEDVYKRCGKIDGVIHGAGIIEDKLLRDKTPASFDRVIRPKVFGALALMARLRPESLRFLVFFSSVSARYGNRGQSDYAAANEVLDKLALWLNARWPGRILSINWGPWKTENGMVSDALASQFAKAGVQLIAPQDGQKIFVSELLFGKKEEAEVVWGGPIFHSAEAAAALRTSVITSQLPLLAGRTEFHENGDGSLQVVRETTPAVDLYLEHHKLDGKAVLPMAMVLELFAEVAAARNPGKHVLQIRDLRMLRGVVFDQDVQTLRVQASDAGNGVVDLKLETASGRGLHYSAKAEIDGSQPQSTMRPGLRIEGASTLSLSLPEIYESWLFHGPTFAGIERIEAIGENGIVAYLKPSRPSEMFSYKPREKWLVDPVVVDSGLQLLIVWARHFLDATPLPSKLGICHVFGSPVSDKIRCEIKVHHQAGSNMLRSDLQFFDEANRMFARLEDMEVTFSKALNRLGGAVATAGGTH
jgi:NAD(P)-dependent dehydrogenase (short-subunit alcohol dehydrogenase family)/acyl carrier protein